VNGRDHPVVEPALDLDWHFVAERKGQERDRGEAGIGLGDRLEVGTRPAARSWIEGTASRQATPSNLTPLRASKSADGTRDEALP